NRTKRRRARCAGARRAPENKPLVGDIKTKLVVGGPAKMAGVPAGVTASAMAALLLKRAMQSPWWRSTMAINRTKFAGLLCAGDSEGAADFAASIAGAHAADEGRDSRR